MYILNIQRSSCLEECDQGWLRRKRREEESRGAAGDKWVRPERLFFTSDTCTSPQIPHQGLTLSPSFTIVCWRALQTLLWIPPSATPSGLSPALPKRQTKKRIPKRRPLGIPVPLGDKEENFGLIHSSTLHPSSQSPPKKSGDDEEEEEKRRLARGSGGVVSGSQSD